MWRAGAVAARERGAQERTRGERRGEEGVASSAVMKLQTGWIFEIHSRDACGEAADLSLVCTRVRCERRAGTPPFTSGSVRGRLSGGEGGRAAGRGGREVQAWRRGARGGPLWTGFVCGCGRRRARRVSPLGEENREAQTLMSSISTFTFSSTSMPLAGARSARSSNLGSCDMHAEVFSKKIVWPFSFPVSFLSCGG